MNDALIICLTIMAAALVICCAVFNSADRIIAAIRSDDGDDDTDSAPRTLPMPPDADARRQMFQTFQAKPPRRTATELRVVGDFDMNPLSAHKMKQP